MEQLRPLSMKSSLRSFIEIFLQEVYDCLAKWTSYSKGEVSLDLRLADGMSFKTQLQVIDADTTYDILLGMDFMEENCVNSGFYRTQQGPRKAIEIEVVDSLMILHSTLDITRRLKAFLK